MTVRLIAGGSRSVAVGQQDLERADARGGLHSRIVVEPIGDLDHQPGLRLSLGQGGQGQ